MLTDPEEDYARGQVPFLECTIFLDSRPLIPRTETEFWTEIAIKQIGTRNTVTCLDLFAGSGAIGVAVLKHCPNARVDFSEIDPRHFPTIRKNIESNGIDTSRTHIYQTDVFSNISDQYDFILANPPYISRERMHDVEQSVREHEPEGALYARNDGFELIEKTLIGLTSHLTTSGIAFIEHEPFQIERIKATAHIHNLSAETMKDQYGIDRFTILTHMA